MTPVLQEMVDRLSQLPEAVQAAYAARWLKELEPEKDETAPEQAAEAVRRIQAAPRDRMQRKTLTIRELIKDGWH